MSWLKEFGRTLKRINVSAYTIDVSVTKKNTFFASVRELPGCFAATERGSEMEEALRQAIAIYVDEHPDAPALYAN